MDITRELREHAKTCNVCRAQVGLIDAAKAAVAANELTREQLEWLDRHASKAGPTTDQNPIPGKIADGIPLMTWDHLMRGPKAKAK